MTKEQREARKTLAALRKFKKDIVKNTPKMSDRINGHTTKRTATQECVALACNPKQAARRQEAARKAGFTAIEYTKDGRAFVPSFGSQRTGYFKFMGLVDSSPGRIDVDS